jgi:hypothetical protein
MEDLTVVDNVIRSRLVSTKAALLMAGGRRGHAGVLAV